MTDQELGFYGELKAQGWQQAGWSEGNRFERGLSVADYRDHAFEQTCRWA